MEIINFKLHTIKNEAIVLNEVDCISIGEVIPADARVWEKENNGPHQIYVYSKKGQFVFNLNEIDGISFILTKGEEALSIQSCLYKEAGNGAL